MLNPLRNTAKSQAVGDLLLDTAASVKDPMEAMPASAAFHLQVDGCVAIPMCKKRISLQ